MAILLGFGYKASSGKDTSADYLKNIYGWYKTSYACNLKSCLIFQFGFSEYQVFSTGGKESLLKQPLIYTEELHKKVVDWMAVSLGEKVEGKINTELIGTRLDTPRAALQFVGTSIMRGLVPDYHIKCCFRNIPEDVNVIISDVRFPDEGQAIIDRRGFCIETQRDIILLDDKYANHRSEEAMKGWGGWFATIDNNGSFDSLYKQIDKKIGDIQDASR